MSIAKERKQGTLPRNLLIFGDSLTQGLSAESAEECYTALVQSAMHSVNHEFQTIRAYGISGGSIEQIRDAVVAYKPGIAGRIIPDYLLVQDTATTGYTFDQYAAAVEAIIATVKSWNPVPHIMWAGLWAETAAMVTWRGVSASRATHLRTLLAAHPDIRILPFDTISQEPHSKGQRCYATSNGGNTWTILAPFPTGYDPVGQGFCLVEAVNTSGDVWVVNNDSWASPITNYDGHLTITTEEGMGTSCSNKLMFISNPTPWITGMPYGDDYHPTTFGHTSLAVEVIHAISELDNADMLRRPAVTRPRGTIDNYQAYTSGSLNTVKLSWTGYATGATVKRRLAGDTTWTNLRVNPTSNPIIDTIPTQGSTYIYRLEAESGQVLDLTVPTPYLSTSASIAKVWTPTLDASGVLYAMCDDGSQSIRKSTDGGRTWSVVKSGGGLSGINIVGDVIFGNSSYSWSGVKGQIGMLGKAGTGSWAYAKTPAEATLVMRDPDGGGDANYTYWYRGALDQDDTGRIVIGACNQYSNGGGAYTSANAGNTIYTSTDYGAHFTESLYWPGGNTYDRHMHECVYNPYVSKWLISYGDYSKKTYLCNQDLSNPIEILPATSGLPGGGIAIAIVDDGVLLGTDDAGSARVMKVGHDGSNPRVVLALPSDLAASQCWGMGSYQDGEVWAVFYSPSADQSVWTSQDNGTTWRMICRVPSSVFTGGSPATYLHRQVVGDWVTFDQQDSSSKPGVTFHRLGGVV